MGNVGGHQSENELQRKQSEQDHIKRLTRKFLEFYRCSRPKQRQRNVLLLCCTCKVVFFFVLIRPTNFFGRFCWRRRLALHDFIFYLSKL